MTKDEFLKLLSDEVKTYKSYLETDRQDWIVKGFVDIDRNVYAITNDTKVVSKIIEILLIPKLESFARANGMEMELPSRQNYYPDLTFKDGEGNLFAVDFKSSYYAGDSVNGLTLGSYWGVFPREGFRQEYGPHIQFIRLAHSLGRVVQAMWRRRRRSEGVFYRRIAGNPFCDR